MDHGTGLCIHRGRTEAGGKSREGERGKGTGREGGLFVGWLLNVPATGECISGKELLRQFYALPH